MAENKRVYDEMSRDVSMFSSHCPGLLALERSQDRNSIYVAARDGCNHSISELARIALTDRSCVRKPVEKEVREKQGQLGHFLKLARLSF